MMKLGVIQQFDTPDQVYHFPANLFVADFIGNPKVNLLDGRVNGDNCVQVADFKIPVETQIRHMVGNMVIAVRPEDITILNKPQPEAVEFTAYSVLPAGANSTIMAQRGETELTIKVMGISKLHMDEKIWLKFNPETLNLYDKESGNLLLSHN